MASSVPAAPVGAASYDGSVPLLCAAIQIMECDAAGECHRRTAENVNLPRFIKLDFAKKTMSGAGADQRTAPIARFERANGRIIMHGGQEGRAWSLVIDGDTGNMSAGAFKGLEDLSNRRIGIVPGTTTEKALAEFLAREFVKVRMVNVKDHAEGLAALEARTIDAYASDRGILIGLALATGDPKRFALANALFSYEPYGLMLRRNDAAFRLVVNRALAELYRSARIAGIYDRWFGAFGRPSPALQSMYLLNGLPE